MARKAIVDVDACKDEAFGLAEDYAAFASKPHAHEKHQLLYAETGTLVLVTQGNRWLLPPQRAAWIAARAEHTVSSSTGVKLRTVYVAHHLAPRAMASKVFSVSALAREMILHAMRYPPGAKPGPTREAFLRALSGLASEWMEEEQPFSLPIPKSEELGRATRWVEANLAEATIEEAARVAHVSVRTLARRFEDETQMSFRQYLTSARMLAAMELLAKPRASVTATAHAVGFSSLGAFTTSFTERCGETPSAYRARITRR